jgi:hypothetical protein
MTKLHSIMVDDRVIEIHYNDILKNKPYLVRVFDYNNYYPNEFRLNETELQDLYKILNYNENLEN